MTEMFADIVVFYWKTRVPRNAIAMGGLIEIILGALITWSLIYVHSLIGPRILYELAGVIFMA